MCRITLRILRHLRILHHPRSLSSLRRRTRMEMATRISGLRAKKHAKPTAQYAVPQERSATWRREENIREHLCLLSIAYSPTRLISVRYTGFTAGIHLTCGRQAPNRQREITIRAAVACQVKEAQTWKANRMTRNFQKDKRRQQCYFSCGDKRCIEVITVGKYAKLFSIRGRWL